MHGPNGGLISEVVLYVTLVAVNTLSVTPFITVHVPSCCQTTIARPPSDASVQTLRERERRRGLEGGGDMTGITCITCFYFISCTELSNIFNC